MQRVSSYYAAFTLDKDVAKPLVPLSRRLFCFVAVRVVPRKSIRLLAGGQAACAPPAWGLVQPGAAQCVRRGATQPSVTLDLTQTHPTPFSTVRPLAYTPPSLGVLAPSPWRTRPARNPLPPRLADRRPARRPGPARCHPGLVQTTVLRSVLLQILPLPHPCAPAPMHALAPAYPGASSPSLRVHASPCTPPSCNLCASCRT